MLYREYDGKLQLLEVFREIPILLIVSLQPQNYQTPVPLVRSDATLGFGYSSKKDF
jgi:hypothetical protein|tara:strand:+ start:328 stop:495 length:168 start_codon:yes stop_codon:yes gene_type:complete